MWLAGWERPSWHICMQEIVAPSMAMWRFFRNQGSGQRADEARPTQPEECCGSCCWREGLN